MTYSQEARAPVFIVGCSRSGTTVIQSILARIPGIVSFPEMNFLYRLMPDLQLRRYGRAVGARALPRLLARSLLPAMGLTNVNIEKHADRLVRSLDREDLRHLLPDGSHRLGPWFAAFAEVMSEAAGGRRWIEKSPQNLFCVAHIERHVRGARLVHVVRNGLDNVGSLIDASDRYEPFHARFNGPHRVRDATAYWNQCVRISARYRARPRHAVVRYEDVVEHGGAALAPVAELLGEHLSDDMLVYRTDGIVRAGETWKLRGDEAIRPQESKFTTALTSAEQEFVRRNALDVESLVPRIGELAPGSPTSEPRSSA